MTRVNSPFDVTEINIGDCWSYILYLKIVSFFSLSLGVDPAELKNSNTGVFIGTSNSDAREAWTSADVSGK